MIIELAAELISYVSRHLLNSARGKILYALFSLLQNLILIPITMFAAFLVALLDEFPVYDGINIETVSALAIALTLFMAIAVVFAHIISFKSGYRNVISRVGLPIVDEKDLGMSLREYQGYLINTAQFFVTVAAVIGAILWYLFPEKNRLEPLTVILATLAAFMTYVRNQYKIPNPLDSVFIPDSEQEVSSGEDLAKQ